MSPSNEPKQDAQRPSSTPEPADTKEKGKETSETPFDDPSTDSNDVGSPPSATSSASTSPTPAPSTDISASAWQAIYSPQHNAYYFYNSSTNETTWINPLQPSPSDPSPTDPNGTDPDGSDGSVEPNPYDPNSLEARAIAAGIDPSLAHLDPTLLAGSSSMAPTGTFTAKFNTRTGTFTAANARAPSHLSEYDRMKRMSEFYFDVGAWEQDVEHRDAEEKEAGGKKRKRPTKKDLDRFKEQKKLKKIAKTAWLRT
ncbi:hypothetical protein BDN67DRAFT_964372 [Paxillus ammoniavirescens]|nr:hypothetical protein BDN67DRAFT_964372 [Paxillus ammoniavirescens]